MGKKFSAGFTLIELLIVIAILGILAAGVLVAITPSQQFAKVRDARRKSDARQINDALERYLIINGSYPKSSKGIFWLSSLDSPPWIPELVSRGDLKNVPIDPVNIRNQTNNDLYYSYTSNESDYCLQVIYETDMSNDPNIGGGPGAWVLRYGPNGPTTEGLCGER